MKQLIDYVMLALLLSACGGGGSSAPSVSNPVLVPLLPGTQQVQLTFTHGSSWSCYLDVQSAKSVLYCWGTQSDMGLTAQPQPVASVNRAAGIANLTVMNESLCFETTGHTPYDQQGSGLSTYCFGRPNTVNGGSFGGQPIVSTQFTGTWSTFNFTQDAQLNLGVRAIIGADMSLNAYFALNPTFDGINGVGQYSETCDVIGTHYVCQSVTLDLN